MLSRDPHRPFDLLDKVNELNKRVRELELRDVPTRAELPTSTGTPSTWIECDSNGIWLTPPGGYPSSVATVDWGTSGSDVTFSSDITRLDASTFQMPSGTYYFEWIVWGWVWHWTTSVSIPFDGDGWIGFNAGVASISQTVSSSIFEYGGPINRVRANFNGDTVTVNDFVPGGYQDAVVLASGTFSSYNQRFPLFPHDKFSLALSSIPEFYEEALDTRLNWNWPFAEDASNWGGDHWLRVSRIGDSDDA